MARATRSSARTASAVASEKIAGKKEPPAPAAPKPKAAAKAKPKAKPAAPKKKSAMKKMLDALTPTKKRKQRASPPVDERASMEVEAQEPQPNAPAKKQKGKTRAHTRPHLTDPCASPLSAFAQY